MKNLSFNGSFPSSMAWIFMWMYMCLQYIMRGSGSGSTRRGCHHVQAFSTKAVSPSPSPSPLLYVPFHVPNNREQPQLLVRSVAAPMVAASDFAFRCLCRQYGVDLTFTQMLHVRNLNKNAQFRSNHVDLYETALTVTSDATQLPPLTTVAQNDFLNGMERYNDNELPCDNWQDYTQGPVMVQLAGHEPEAVVRAAKWLVDHSDGLITGIDLNGGCPQQIARKGNYGAFFMEADNGIQASQVMKALRQALPWNVKVSTKCRLPLESHLLRARVERLQDAGIDFLTIHGRTLRENKTLTGPSHTDAIRQAVEWLNIPVVANGGVENAADVQRIFQQTGAAAVMSSEGLLERPDLFTNTETEDNITPRARLERQFQIARDYLRWARLYPPLPGVLGQEGGSFNIVRGHLFKFLHPYWQEQVDLREALASHKRRLFLQDSYGLVDSLYERYASLDDAALEVLASSSIDSSWYRRHWKANGVVSTTSARHAKQVQPLTVTERKALLQTRIAKLKEQRKERMASSVLP